MRQVVKNVKIVGTGSYTPATIYTNKYLETLVPTNDEWIRENLGIQERHIAGQDEFTSDLATQAGLRAVQDAGLDVMDIDLIIVAASIKLSNVPVSNQVYPSPSKHALSLP